MNHPVAVILVTRVQKVIAHTEKILDVIAKFVQERIAVPDFIENDERKFVGSRWRHI